MSFSKERLLQNDLQKGLTLDASRVLNKHQGTISHLVSRAAKDDRLQKIVDELVNI